MYECKRTVTAAGQKDETRWRMKILFFLKILPLIKNLPIYQVAMSNYIFFLENFE
jgi:hypothetical protein